MNLSGPPLFVWFTLKEKLAFFLSSSFFGNGGGDGIETLGTEFIWKSVNGVSL